MPNNKEKLDDVEAGLGLVHESISSVQEEVRRTNNVMEDRLQRMESSFAKMLEDTVTHMRELITTSRECGTSTVRDERGPDEPRFHRDERGDNDNPFTQKVKLDFLRFHSGDPEEWLNKAKQYFAYHDIPPDQKVSFASYHLAEEANVWWQAKLRGRGFDVQGFLWEAFEAELWTRFGPSDGEDFEEALCHIRQQGTLIEY